MHTVPCSGAQVLQRHGSPAALYNTGNYGILFLLAVIRLAEIASLTSYAKRIYCTGL